MKPPSIIAAATLIFGLVQGQGSFKHWEGPGYGDVRGPCPMLNTLANHGFLPHDGKRITLERTIHALGKALNIGEDVSTRLFGFANTTNPDPTAGYFSLENLGRHNILEHDASLSRADFDVTGDSVSFNRAAYDETRSYWKDEIITVPQAVAARKARYATSKATNPKYSMSELGDTFSAGETAAYLIVFGDLDKLIGYRRFIKYFFERERLPTKLGWCRSNYTFTNEDLDSGIELIQNATGATGEKLNRMRKTREIHGGRFW